MSAPVTAEPFYVISRSPSHYDWEMSKFVHSHSSWKTKRSMGSGLDFPGMIQEFLYPKGPNACLSRICYKTRHYRGLDRSFGFKIRNNLRLDDPNSKSSLAQKATICKDQTNSFEVYSLKFGVVQEYGRIAQRLVDFLERALRLRITEIVLDFITDRDEKHWLFNMKALRVVCPDREVFKALQEKRENKNELSCSVYCKLCGLIFKKDEASKTLTYKLLWEFARHLKKRGGKLKNLDLNHSSTRPCRVCDLCYMVVVSEHELIELEQQFALAQNVPIKDPFIRVPLEKKAKHRPALLGEILNQWRLMVFAQTLSFEDSQDKIEELRLVNKKIFFQIKLANIKSVFEICLQRGQQQYGRRVYQMKILRIFYFFSETKSIGHFLEDSELQFRLTLSKDFNNYLAHGSTRSFRNFENERTSGQKHASTVYMFFDDASIATLKCMLGLVCDRNHDTGSMNLYKFHGIYFPNQDFYNCNIFPLEWLEVFADDGVLREETEDWEDSAKKSGKVGQKYTPFCTGNELRKMLEGKVRIRTTSLRRLKSPLSAFPKTHHGKKGRLATGGIRQRGVQTGQAHFHRRAQSNKLIDLSKAGGGRKSSGGSVFPQIMSSNLLQKSEINSEKIQHQKRVSELKSKNKASAQRKSMFPKPSQTLGSGFSKGSFYRKRASRENCEPGNKISTLPSHQTNPTTDISTNSFMFRVDADEHSQSPQAKGARETPARQAVRTDSDLKAQNLISGFNQQFRVSRFDAGTVKTQTKEKQAPESSFEEPEEISEEGRI